LSTIALRIRSRSSFLHPSPTYLNRHIVGRSDAVRERNLVVAGFSLSLSMAG